ncbi:MAG: isochorismatase family protein [Paracoccaceae bacterium]
MAEALLVIDVQRGVIEGRRPVDAAAGKGIAALLALFRGRGLPVVHVHHDAPDPAETVRRGQPGAEPLALARPAAGEQVFWKRGSSGFSGTDLDTHLRGAGIDRLVVCGAVAAFCVASTVRAASDLGYGVLLPTDALYGFDLWNPQDGGMIDGAVAMQVTLAILGSDFARLTTVAELAALPGAG